MEESSSRSVVIDLTSTQRPGSIVVQDRAALVDERTEIRTLFSDHNTKGRSHTSDSMLSAWSDWSDMDAMVPFVSLNHSKLYGHTHNVSEDSWPHEVDHLGHLIDVGGALTLQLLRQCGEGTQHAGRYRSQPDETQSGEVMCPSAASWCRDAVKVAVKLAGWHFCLIPQNGFHQGIVDKDWTSMGPMSAIWEAEDLRTNVRTGRVYSGTPMSGHWTSTASSRIRQRNVRAETTTKGTSHSTRPSPAPVPDLVWWVRSINLHNNHQHHLPTSVAAAVTLPELTPAPMDFNLCLEPNTTSGRAPALRCSWLALAQTESSLQPSSPPAMSEIASVSLVTLAVVTAEAEAVASLGGLVGSGLWRAVLRLWVGVGALLGQTELGKDEMTPPLKPRPASKVLVTTDATVA
ncbi:hypothetical protein EYF80_001411 [Liparis tanakae]|uniref:Uncharacterized protein n=1 Tax=Liparis tanakae TaxID=230148 RepID=A0A4Z2JD17_9TELE|nr:hypothetical protein EYF80_001411 [Liparis tanakae]